MQTPVDDSDIARIRILMDDAEVRPMVQGVQNELASAKEALKAADSSSQVQQLQGLVEELQASKADLQQLVQSLQVTFYNSCVKLVVINCFFGAVK